MEILAHDERNYCVVTTENKNKKILDESNREEWNETLLSQAAWEIASRTSPLVPENSDFPAATIARLQGELDREVREKEKLEAKCTLLQQQYKILASQKETRKKKRK